MYKLYLVVKMFKGFGMSKRSSHTPSIIYSVFNFDEVMNDESAHFVELQLYKCIKFYYLNLTFGDI